MLIDTICIQQKVPEKQFFLPCCLKICAGNSQVSKVNKGSNIQKECEAAVENIRCNLRCMYIIVIYAVKLFSESLP